jgi:hypothetical protein
MQASSGEQIDATPYEWLPEKRFALQKGIGLWERAFMLVIYRTTLVN